MQIDFDFDLRHGRPAPTKDGRFFRFSLIVKEGDSHLLEIPGFRVNLGLTHIYPPMSRGNFGTGFPVVDLDPAFSKRLLEQASTYLKGQGVTSHP